MLGGPYLKIFRFNGLSRFHHCIFCSKRGGRNRLIWIHERLEQLYKKTLVFSIICLIQWGLLMFSYFEFLNVLCFIILRFPKCPAFRRFSRLHHCQIPFSPKHVGETDRSGPTQILKLFINRYIIFNHILIYEDLIMFSYFGILIFADFHNFQ